MSNSAAKQAVNLISNNTPPDNACTTMASILASGPIRKFADAIEEDPERTRMPVAARNFLAKVIDPNFPTTGGSASTGSNVFKNLKECAGIHNFGLLVSVGKEFEVIVNPRVLCSGGHPHHQCLFGIAGELVDNAPSIVKLEEELFELGAHQVAVRTTEETVKAFTDDPTLEILEPPQGTRTTTSLSFRKGICLIPHSLLPKMLRCSDRLTPRVFWTEIFPLINTDELKEECKQLIDHFRVLSTASTAGGDTSEAVATAFPSPLRRQDREVNAMMAEAIYGLVPSLRSGSQEAGIAALNVTLAQGMSGIQGSTEAARQEQKVAREKAEAKQAQKKTLEGKLGALRAARIRRMLGVHVDSELEGLVWSHWNQEEGKSAESFRIALQEKIDEKARLNNWVSAAIPLVPLPVAKAILEGNWYKLNSQSLSDGAWSNFILFGKHLEDWTNQQIAVSRAAVEAGAVTAFDDVQTLLQMKVQLPANTSVAKNVKRMHLVASVVFPSGHPFLGFLQDLKEHLDNYSDTIEGLVLTGEYEGMDAALGFLLLETLTIKLNRYWREIDLGACVMEKEPPNLQEFFDKLSDGEQVLPVMFPKTYMHKLGIKAWCARGTPSMLETGADGTLRAAPQAGPPAGTSTFSPAPTPGRPTPPPPSDGGGGGGNSTLTNPEYNRDLFGEFKGRKQNGKEIPVRSLRDKINSPASLPPQSKHYAGRMCVAYHVKGMCNVNCGRAGDHHVYTSAEYQELVNWCQQHYPKGDS